MSAQYVWSLLCECIMCEFCVHVSTASKKTYPSFKKYEYQVDSPFCDKTDLSMPNMSLLSPSIANDFGSSFA